MALDTTTQTALANEARRQAAQTKVATLQGAIASQASTGEVLSRQNGDTLRQLQSAQAELTAILAGAGAGLTSDFGAYSSVDQLLRTERFAGKSASVDFIKANPTCAEVDAIAAWTTAALAATGLTALVVPAENYATLYRTRLKSAGMVPDITWESQRAWIVATDKATIMGA